MRKLLPLPVVVCLVACAGVDLDEVDDPAGKGDDARGARPEGTFTRESGEAPFAELALRHDDQWFARATPGAEESLGEGEIRWSRSTTTDARFIRLFADDELSHRFAWTLSGDTLTLIDPETDDKAVFRRAAAPACREVDDDCVLQGYAGSDSCIGSWTCDGGCTFRCYAKDDEAIVDCVASRIYDYGVLEESFTEWEYPSVDVTGLAGGGYSAGVGGSGFSTADGDTITHSAQGGEDVFVIEPKGWEGAILRITVAPGGAAQRRGLIEHSPAAARGFDRLAEIRCW